MKANLLESSRPVAIPHVGTKSKIKVTYFVTSLRDGGTERQVLELIHHLDPEKFVVSIILMSPTGSERTYGYVADCFALGIPEGGNSRWFGRSISIVNAINRTRKQLLAWDCDIVHAFLPGPSIIGSLAARLARVPVFVGSRRSLLSLYRRGGRMSALADSIAFRLATLNLGNSTAVMREIIDKGKCPENKCRTIYNGVDVHRFHPAISRVWRRIVGWDDQHVVFGMLANFRTCKRQVDFVDAAAIISKKNKDARFFLMGLDQGSRSSVIHRVHELGIQNKVQVFDSDPFPEKILAALDVYVCTSDSEGFSNVLLEAMACGKPVIATNVGGNPEAVTDDENGFLVPCHSPESVARAAEKLLADADLGRAMGMKGRRMAEQRFSLEQMVKTHENLYLDLIEKRRDSK
jgi:glycosyltransferase involved in cell wall biosynthesis